MKFLPAAENSTSYTLYKLFESYGTRPRTTNFDRKANLYARISPDTDFSQACRWHY